MILNQGEFANFLTSSFKERKDILEKFYDGQKLELLSIKTRQKINELSQTIDNKFHQIEGLQDYSEIDIEDSKLKVKSLKQIKSLAEEAKVFLELNFDRFKDIKKYIQENQISLKRLTSLSETIKETTQ